MTTEIESEIEHVTCEWCGEDELPGDINEVNCINVTEQICDDCYRQSYECCVCARVFHVDSGALLYCESCGDDYCGDQGFTNDQNCYEYEHECGNTSEYVH